MKCFWCEKQTDNETEEVLNGDLLIVRVSFCDRCKEAKAECARTMEYDCVKEGVVHVGAEEWLACGLCNTVIPEIPVANKGEDRKVTLRD